jgi:hypothetical protein
MAARLVHGVRGRSGLTPTHRDRPWRARFVCGSRRAGAGHARAVAGRAERVEDRFPAAPAPLQLCCPPP